MLISVRCFFLFTKRSDTEIYFMKREKEEREKKEGGGDNRSFLQKYVSITLRETRCSGQRSKLYPNEFT